MALIISVMTIINIEINGCRREHLILNLSISVFKGSLWYIKHLRNRKLNLYQWNFTDTLLDTYEVSSAGNTNLDSPGNIFKKTE